MILVFLEAKHAEAARMIMEPLTAAVIPVYPAKVREDSQKKPKPLRKSKKKISKWTQTLGLVCSDFEQNLFNFFYCFLLDVRIILNQGRDVRIILNRCMGVFKGGIFSGYIFPQTY